MNAHQETAGKKRLAAIAALAAVLIITLFSSCFIVLEADHECTGPSCEICAMLAQCGDTLRLLGSGQDAAAPAAAALCLLCLTAAACVAAPVPDTPITRKVRLND